MSSAWLTRSRVHAIRPAWGGRNLFASVYRVEVTTTYTSIPISTYRRAYSQSVSSRDGPTPRVAIVGSGPAGFYTARKLMREIHGTKIDMYEQLPVPFGLVRFGVAPDHPEVKKCQEEFEQVASSPEFNFVGNIQLGHDLPLPILAKHYDAVVFAYGASKDKELGLEGEDKPNVYSARSFVGWYNGLPEYRNLDPDLSTGEVATVIGQGNVALDVARILLSKLDKLKKTDLTEYAVDTLEKSKIKHVHVVGRRGPMQAAFTIKEVRELLQLEGVNFQSIPPELFPPDLKKLERPKRRLMELLQKGKPNDPNATRSWSLQFLLSPNALIRDKNNPDVLKGVSYSENVLEDISDPASRVSAKGKDKNVTLETSLLFRSIGYRAEAIPGMELVGANFNTRSGILHHDGVGRILPIDVPEHKNEAPTTNTNITQQPQAVAPAKAHLYCAGWVKRGPTGVIASTMSDAFQTAEAIVQDWRNAITKSDDVSTEAGLGMRGWPAVKAEAESQGYDLTKVVNWDGWRRIDAVEKETGKGRGKPREKFGTVSEMANVASVPI
ncbi:NADPH-adrenodoxin reductase [Lithohypha guttulata]|nr:NADPH-adrenodoxin reductase [Lithohypha guttulata]